MSEPDFLARLYDLESLPSLDYRYSTAYADICQHRVNNEDWDDDWVFYDSRFSIDSDDAAFLAFLAETVHPVVRLDESEAREIVQWFNSHLERDGWNLVVVDEISGYPVFGARETLAVPLALSQVADTVSPEDRSGLHRQITRMSSHIESDPDLAIGTAKELVESCCHTILEALGEPVDKNWTLSKLVRQTAVQLQLTPEGVADDVKASASIRQILGSLGQIVQGVGEVRNSYGSGHGRALRSSGLSARHARLTVGAASTLVSFLFETYEYRYGKED